MKPSDPDNQNIMQQPTKSTSEHAESAYADKTTDEPTKKRGHSIFVGMATLLTLGVATVCAGIGFFVTFSCAKTGCGFFSGNAIVLFPLGSLLFTGPILYSAIRDE